MTWNEITQNEMIQKTTQTVPFLGVPLYVVLAAVLTLIVVILAARRLTIPERFAAGVLFGWMVIVLAAAALCSVPFWNAYDRLDLRIPDSLGIQVDLNVNLIRLLVLLPFGLLQPVFGQKRFLGAVLLGVCAGCAIEILQSELQKAPFSMWNLIQYSVGVIVGWVLWRIFLSGGRVRY